MRLVIKQNIIPDAPKAAKVAGRGVFNLIQAHLREKNANTPPKSGFPKSNYWAEAADSMRVATQGNTAIITVKKEGAALHYYGGTVVPTTKKHLAIPLVGMIWDQWPRELGKKLKIQPTKKKDYYLLKDPDTSEALYLLVPSAKIERDETVLPPDDAIYNAALDALLEIKK